MKKYIFLFFAMLCYCISFAQSASTTSNATGSIAPVAGAEPFFGCASDNFTFDLSALAPTDDFGSPCTAVAINSLTINMNCSTDGGGTVFLDIYCDGPVCGTDFAASVPNTSTPGQPLVDIFGPFDAAFGGTGLLALQQGEVITVYISNNDCDGTQCVGEAPTLDYDIDWACATDCAMTCADVAADNCGANQTDIGTFPGPGTTAQVAFGGDGSGTGCQTYADFTTGAGDGIESASAAPFTLCSDWTATLPDAFFPNFEGVITAAGATACFAEQTIQIFDSPACTPVAGPVVSQPDGATATAGQVTGLTIGNTYTICTTYDYSNATDVNGVSPCVPDPAQVTAEICTEIVEFGVPPADPCVAVADPGPGFACGGSDFQIPLDVTGACTTDPTFDDAGIFGVPVQSGYIAFYYSTDGGATFTTCPPGSTADDVLTDPNFIFFGESNAAGGGGCAPVDIGAFVNPTCAPIDIPVCLVNGDVLNFFVAVDTDGDGINDIACDVVETTVTIYPNVETTVILDGGCDNSAYAFVTDGAGGIFDLDGDGLLTPADACDGAVLGGDPLDPAFDPANTADDCTDPSTLDYDFTGALAYLADPNYPGCVEPAVGTLTCACADLACTSVADPGPGFACGGSNFQIPLDVTGACTTDPTFDDAGIFGVPVQSGYIAFYYSTDGGATFTTCPPGSTADDVLTDPNFIFFGESNAAGGGGCAPVDIGAFVNPTCAPIDIPVCLVNGDVLNFFVAVDTDGDGVNDISCEVVETTVTIYPNIETVVVSDGGCDNVAAAFVTDGAGGIIGDLDGDGLVTAADACDIAVLGGNLLDPAVDPADTSDDCADGSTLDYDFTPAYTADADYPGCVEPLTGTLTCACASPVCAVTLTAPPAGAGCDPNDGAGFLAPLDLAACVGADGPAGVGFVYDVFIYAPGGAAGTAAPAGYENTPIPVAAEYPDPFGDGNLIDIAFDLTCADAVGAIALLNPTCDDAVFTFIYVPFDYALDTDGDLVAEYPTDCQPVRVDYTVSPTLTATIDADASATCGTVTASLYDAGGVMCAGTEMTVSCDAATETYPDITLADNGCGPYVITGGACAGCDIAVPGCTDACAPNFDPAADTDDGSCEDYDDTCNADCTVGPFGGTWDPIACACTGETAPVSGCTDPTADNYNPAANCEDGSCMDAPMCSISAAVTSMCDDGGTPEDDSDDVTTYTITVSGSNTGAGFTASVAPDAGALTYGTALTYTVTGTGGLSVTFTDDTDATCTAAVNQNSGCATVANIPTVGEWGLIILGLLMSITAIVGIRARREEEATA